MLNGVLSYWYKEKVCMRKHVIEDAKKCLQCKNPLCSSGCPIHTPIKEAIALLLESKLLEAGKLLFDNNPLSLVCSYVCPQEDQCEGHCVLGRNGAPVFMRVLTNRYITMCVYNNSTSGYHG